MQPAGQARTASSACVALRLLQMRARLANGECEQYRQHRQAVHADVPQHGRAALDAGAAADQHKLGSHDALRALLHAKKCAMGVVVLRGKRARCEPQHEPAADTLHCTRQHARAMRTCTNMAAPVSAPADSTTCVAVEAAAQTCHGGTAACRALCSGVKARGTLLLACREQHSVHTCAAQASTHLSGADGSNVGRQVRGAVAKRHECDCAR